MNRLGTYVAGGAIVATGFLVSSYLDESAEACSNIELLETIEAQHQINLDPEIADQTDTCNDGFDSELVNDVGRTAVNIVQGVAIAAIALKRPDEEQESQSPGSQDSEQ